eukprot:NODE_3187_length_377_cov_114.030488_g3105_i0.p1 GENE.NODE_3187_length_377_cov_114.030488_g3105_i0~~NODE_3187_length_377_cov_114.030488_g3105_i0.p1  ORF type:complete len:114 (+),score=27.73 NODE_3187_length_377_cov_114.030488_g3105_i0:52-342(+)
MPSSCVVGDICVDGSARNDAMEEDWCKLCAPYFAKKQLTHPTGSLQEDKTCVQLGYTKRTATRASGLCPSGGFLFVAHNQCTHCSTGPTMSAWTKP